MDIRAQIYNIYIYIIH